MQIGFQTILEQSQVLSQNQIQSLQILAMDNQELNEFLLNEYLENPLLQHSTEDSTDEPGKESKAQDFSADIWEERGTGRCGTYDLQNVPAETAWDNSLTLKYFLLDQINLREYSALENKIMEFLIDCLDGNGFFSMSAEEAAKIIKAPENTVKRCLSVLRSLKPDGIFSVDLPHCLLRQLEVKGEDDPYIHAIIENHLMDIAEGRISNISRTLKLSTAQVRKYIVAIKHLNPRPLTGMSLEKTRYIVPDIMVSYKDKKWDIELNDKWMGDYYLSSYYINMMKTAGDKELLAYFKKNLEKARFILRSIEQRRTTIYRITDAVLRFQKEYFTGKGALKPMSITEVARELNIHASTVSRGIKGKYIQFQSKTIKMKSLFLPCASSQGDGRETPEAIKAKIKKMIEEENTEHPYSDQELAERLEAECMMISRRTVAKYRRELGIGTTYDRKLSNT